MKQPINIVWLKRDLRTQDHAPLQAAEKAPEDYLILYLFEPHLLDYPDTSLRHSQFIFHSLKEMDRRLKPIGRKVEQLYAEAVDAFELLCAAFEVKQVFSYRESGIRLTWERDKAVKKLFDSQGVQWEECEKDGVKRGINNRKGWDKNWFVNVLSKQIENTYQKAPKIHWENPFPLPDAFEEKLKAYPDAFQKAGESYAWKYLHSFLKGRGKITCDTFPNPQIVACRVVEYLLTWPGGILA